MILLVTVYDGLSRMVFACIAIYSLLASLLRTVCSRETSAGTIHFCTTWPHILQQNRLCSHAVQGSKRQSKIMQGHCKSRLRTGLQSFPQLSIGWKKSWDPPRFKGWENRLHLLMEGAEKFYCKGCAYREGWRFSYIFAINLLIASLTNIYHRNGIEFPKWIITFLEPKRS